VHAAGRFQTREVSGIPVAGTGKGYQRPARGGARARRLSKMNEVSEARQ